MLLKKMGYENKYENKKELLDYDSYNNYLFEIIFVEEAALRSNGNRNFGDKNMSIAGMDWYVMRTIPGKEQESVMLLEKKINHRLWENLRILKKQQLFRTRGKYLLSTKELFPGYIFIETTSPKDLEKEFDYRKIVIRQVNKDEDTGD